MHSVSVQSSEKVRVTSELVTDSNTPLMNFIILVGAFSHISHHMNEFIVLTVFDIWIKTMFIASHMSWLNLRKQLAVYTGKNVLEANCILS